MREAYIIFTDLVPDSDTVKDFLQKWNVKLVSCITWGVAHLAKRNSAFFGPGLLECMLGCAPLKRLASVRNANSWRVE